MAHLRVLASLLLICCCLAPSALAQSLPVSGEGCGSLTSFMTSLLNRYQMPGATVAIGRNGQLKAACAFGYADRNSRVEMKPVTLMRLASVSKPFTAVAAMKLVQDGKLKLDDKAVDWLRDWVPAAGPADARWNDITVRHLLNHTGGWDRMMWYDPMFISSTVSSALGRRGPATSEMIGRYMLTQPLQFTPGTRMAYSNFGFALLGHVVARAGGKNYEQYVREDVLAPAGIYGMRVGRSLPEGRTSGMSNPDSLEAVYHASGMTSSVFPWISTAVPSQYGGWYLEAMDSHGAWLASAPDLVRFLFAIDGRRGPAILNPGSVAQLVSRPSYVPNTTTRYYSFGFDVQTAPGDEFWAHNGLLDGTQTIVMRRGDGTAFAALVNGIAGNYQGFDQELGSGLISIANSANLDATPGDLFERPEYSFQPQPDKAEIAAQGGVVHGASFVPGIVAGSWATIFGWNLAPAARQWRESEIVDGALPKELEGVQVLIDGEPATLCYVSPTQINFQAPESLRPGTVSLRIWRAGISSEPEPVEIRAQAPEWFRYTAAGTAHVAAVHPNGVLVGDPEALPGAMPASPGGIVSMYGTGFANSASGRVITQPVPVAGVQVEIGGTGAGVEYSGLTGAGLFQVNVRIPTLAPGTYPVTLRVNGVRAQLTAQIAIR